MKERGKNYVLFGFCLLISILLINSVIGAASTGYFVPYCEGESCTSINSPNDAKIKSASDKTGIKASDFNNNHITVKDGKIEVEMGKDMNLNVKENSYNLKKGSKLVFDENGKLTDGTVFSAGKEGGTYRLKGTDVKLPENAKVTFKDKQVTIEMPKDSKLEPLNVVDEEAAKGAVFKIKPAEEGGSFNFPNGDSFNGKTLTYEVDKDGKKSLYFNDKEANIDGLKVSNSKEERIDLNFKGEISKTYSGNYLSINKEKSSLVLGKNNAGAGIEVKLSPDNGILKNMKNENVVLRAGKDADDKSGAGSGTIVMSYNSEKQGKSIPGQIQTYGDFQLVDGAKTFKTGLNSKGEKVILAPKTGNDEKSYAFEIKNYDLNGKLLFENLKILMTGNNEWANFFIESPAPENLKKDIEQKREEKKTEQAKPQTASQPASKPQPVPDVTFNTAEPSQATSGTSTTSQPTTTPTTENPLKDMKVSSFGKKPSKQLDMLSDVRYYKNFLGIGSAYESGDAEGTIHETTHGINSILRNTYGRGTGNSNAFYLYNGDFVLLQEPRVTMRDATALLPAEARSLPDFSVFSSTYVYGSTANSWNSNPLHIMDELTAYTNGAFYSGATGKGRTMNVPEFMTYSLALGQAVQTKDPNYWNSANGAQFKSYLGFSLQRGMQAYASQTRTQTPMQSAQQVFNRGLNNNLRDFARKTWGADWTKKNLGF